MGDPAWEAVLRHNIIGTYNVFEASRETGVKRVVFASSGATVSGIESDKPYSDLVAGRYEGLTSWPILTHLSPLRPSGLYGASKVWGEALGRHYADAHGLSVICVRIGRVHAEDRPRSAREFAVWCSQRDIARFLEGASTLRRRSASIFLLHLPQQVGLPRSRASARRPGLGARRRRRKPPPIRRPD